MKFFTSAVVAVSCLASLAAADMLQINNPTTGSVWTTGVSEFVGWSGTCTAMGAAGNNVTVDLVSGPSNAVRYVTTLGYLDCTGMKQRADFTVPATVTSGTYAIIVRTLPQGQESYTNSFEIQNPATPTSAPSASPSNANNPTAGASGTNNKSAATNNGKGAFWVAILGTAAVIARLL